SGSRRLPFGPNGGASIPPRLCRRASSSSRVDAAFAPTRVTPDTPRLVECSGENKITSGLSLPTEPWVRGESHHRFSAKLLTFRRSPAMLVPERPTSDILSLTRRHFLARSSRTITGLTLAPALPTAAGCQRRAQEVKLETQGADRPEAA